MPFNAILFRPGTGISTRVVVRPFGLSLEVVDQDGGESLRIDPSKCELVAGGWDRQSIQISWPGTEGTFALSTSDPQAARELGQIPAFQSALEASSKATRRSHRQGRLGLAVVALVALLPALVVLGLFAFRDQIVSAVLKGIPLSVDQEIGRVFEADILRSKDTVKETEATRAIALIVDRLRQASPATNGFPFTFVVQRNKEVNAFAAPGGLIVVYTGLVDEAGSAEEVAGVLAHEMAHADGRHSMRQLIYGAGLLPLMGLVIGQPDTASLVQGLGQLSELKFSRAQEEDADRAGFETLVAAGLSTEGMASFFDRLAKVEGAPSAFLSTHPSSAGRAAAIRARAHTLGDVKTMPLPIDWDAVKASLAIDPIGPGTQP